MRRNFNNIWRKASHSSRALAASIARAWPKTASMTAEDRPGQVRFALLWAEMILLFAGIPLILGFVPVSRRVIHGTLWIITVYALVTLTRDPRFSWRLMWEGRGWSEESRRRAVRRFLFIASALFVLTWAFDSAALFRFPLERPGFWALVMVLYPPLSALPQEFVCRTFFFERYKDILPRPTTMIAVNALLFGFVHIVFHNWFGPLLSTAGGVIFAMSYAEHRSLKWVSIEHAVYGCYVFTLGLGWYFFRPVWS